MAGIRGRGCLARSRQASSLRPRQGLEGVDGEVWNAARAVFKGGEAVGARQVREAIRASLPVCATPTFDLDGNEAHKVPERSRACALREMPQQVQGC